VQAQHDLAVARPLVDKVHSEAGRPGEMRREGKGGIECSVGLNHVCLPLPAVLAPEVVVSICNRPPITVEVLICNHYIGGNEAAACPNGRAGILAEDRRRSITMGKRISHKESQCGVARPLDAIGDWWSLLIVRDAFDGLRRFGEFQKNLGLAKNILSARLRNLVTHGILDTVPASDGSPYQEYELTEMGRGLFPLLVALRQWGEDFFFEPGEAHVRLVDRKTNLPVRRLELRSHDGRMLRPEDTVVRPPPRSTAKARSR